MAQTPDRIKWPLWQQYLVVLSAATAIAVLLGLFFMFRSAEELDNEPMAQANAEPVLETAPAAADPTTAAANDDTPLSAQPVPRSEPPPEIGQEGKHPPTASTLSKSAPAAKSTGEDRAPKSDGGPAEGAQAFSATANAAEAPKSPAEAKASKPKQGDDANAIILDRPAETPASSTAAAAKPDWLKLDDNGEPCEVTLANGTVLKLDTYGDSYQGYRALVPVDIVKKPDVVLDYQRDRLGAGVGAYYLRLDVAGGKMYWIEVGASGVCRIRRADLNGQDPQILLDLRFQDAQSLAIDAKRRKLYWANHAAGEHPAFGAPPDAARAVWQADLDGSNPRPLFSAIHNLGAVAVEPQSGSVFYFDGPRVVRAEPDGTHETVVIESLDLPNHGVMARYGGFNATIDPKGGKIYWCANQGYIAQANLDGSAVDVISKSWIGAGHILGVGIDTPNARIYWSAGPRMGLWRANTDGSQPQMVAEGMGSPSSVGIDSDNGHVYWTDQKFANGDSYALIRRLRLPPPPVAETLPPPPWISSIDPPRAQDGGKVALHGRHFSRVEHAYLIGDDGRQSDAQFNVVDDRELALTLPGRREGVRRAAIVVKGSGGVTVTLPRGLSVIKPNDRRITVFDRLHESAFCFVVSPEQGFHRVEHSLVFAPEGATASAGGRGNTVLFVKDGGAGSATDATGVVIYHEPFARIARRAWGAGERQYIPVPAIRPSFVESLLEYADNE